MNKSKAFTLIEMLISITIFSLVVGSAIGMFVSAIHSQSKALASQKLFDEISFAIEHMSRYIRMAKKDTGGTCLSIVGSNYENPGGADNKIRFINYKGNCWEFYNEWDSVQKVYRLKERRYIGTPNDEILDLTSADLNVTSLKFNLFGEMQPPLDYFQPRVIISMEIQSVKSPGVTFQIQTFISQRNLDIQL